MYAIVEIAGMQVKVEPGMELWVPYMAKKEPGEKITFDRVMLVADGEDVRVGQPLVEGASVDATVVEHTRGKKLIVFRKKRRKSFHRKRGHRQNYTVIRVENINA